MRLDWFRRASLPLAGDLIDIKEDRLPHSFNHNLMNRESLTDEVLMNLFQSGEEDAFQVVFHRYSSRLVNFAFRFLHEKEAAEDMAQEVLLRIYRQKDRYDAARPFRPWVFSIAARLCSNKLRDLKRKPAVSLDFRNESGEGEASPSIEISEKVSQSPDSVAQKLETVQTVKNALASLPDNQRTAVLLAKYEEMSYEEIALALNASIPSVKSLLFRARESLKKALEAYVQGRE